jgi:hypothetical protein
MTILLHGVGRFSSPNGQRFHLRHSSGDTPRQVPDLGKKIGVSIWNEQQVSEPANKSESWAAA